MGQVSADSVIDSAEQCFFSALLLESVNVLYSHRCTNLRLLTLLCATQQPVPADAATA